MIRSCLLYGLLLVVGTSLRAETAPDQKETDSAARPIGPITLPITELQFEESSVSRWNNPIVLARRFWVQAEFLPTWVRGANTPALVTSSPLGTSRAQTGILSNPGTQVLSGNEQVLSEMRPGFQVRIGGWVDSCRKFGIEGGFLYRSGEDQYGSYGGNSNAEIARPFTNAQTGQSAAQLISFTGTVNGTVAVNSSADPLWGADVLARKNLCCLEYCDDPCNPKRFADYRRLDVLFGYRHYDFSDQVEFTENLFPTDPSYVSGTQIIVRDFFRARNRFDGIVLGVSGECAINRFYVQGAIKLNVGMTTREVSITGQTIVNVPGDVTTVRQGGLLALRSNIGMYTNSDFTVLPEAQFRIGCRITRGLTGYVGYNVLIWPNVARATEQIDSTVNPDLIPPPVDPITGEARPAITGNTSTFWMQGVSFGLEWRF